MTSTTGLTSQTVQSIAKLARLYEDMSDELVEEYTTELSGILDLADQLQQIDTSSVDFLDGLRTITIEELREDIPSEGEDYDRVKQNIINNFPNQQNNLLVIQGIFESD
jgi:aspartyl/glutamyl-tRNA(Asn/Gln) amidotransferase C subunit